METTAVVASADIARRLDVPEGHPLLQLRCTPYDFEGAPVCCAELLFCGDRYSYKWTVTR